MAISLQQVKDDLFDIRFYYSRSELFEKAEKYLGAHEIEDKAAAYGEAIKAAPARLFALYAERYIFNNKCEHIAKKWGYTTDYIKILNKKLYAYFAENVTEI